MRVCICSLALASLASTQLVSAAPVAGSAKLIGRDDAAAIQYVPGSVDWDKVDWSQVNWSAVSWDAVNWQSVFSSEQPPIYTSEALVSSAQSQPPSVAPAPPSVVPQPSKTASAPVPTSVVPTSVVPVPTPTSVVLSPTPTLVVPAPAPTSVVPPPSTPTPTPTPTPSPKPQPSSSPNPSPEPVYTPESTSEPVTSSAAAPEPEKPASSGSLWGLTYSPYNTDGSCPDVGTVTSQLQKVAGVTSNIRLYSTDCSQLRNALQAISSSNLNLGIHAGLWISDGDSRMQSDLDEFIAATKQYDSSLVKGVSVGNEDLSKGMSESTLIGYINQVRARLQSEGLGHIPVYATEQDAHFTKAIAAVCDVVQVNIYSIFDSIFTSVDSSVKSVIQRADNIKNNVAGGKPVRFGETGWSSAGSTGPSPLSLASEIAYVQKFKCAAAAAGYDYFYFEAKDALWKKGQALSEQSFGIFGSDFVQKFDFGLLNLC
ncbi:hypothetical protein GGH15_005565 [Coemansia sp. RSA 562]|nr:hypothetical protein GGH15_005565 [Coemansia sp. RSA 562]